MNPQNNHNGVQLTLSHISKTFGNQPVLRDISLTIQPGEFMAVIGRSGCGKSTLLRLIARLEQQTDGSILIDDQMMNALHPDTRIMFQDARLLPWKKVIENVQIGTQTGSKALAQAALEHVGLAHKADEWPRVLSGGQQQRVALARALAGNPRLLLLDEPLGALDALTRIEMQLLIERLWMEQGFTAILVTHDVSEAVNLADRVLLIEEGRILADIRINLPRPREKDSSFAHYEKQLLDRLMARTPHYSQTAI